jgi:hypothetical protein
VVSSMGARLQTWRLSVGPVVPHSGQPLVRPPYSPGKSSPPARLRPGRSRPWPRTRPPGP